MQPKHEYEIYTQINQIQKIYPTHTLLLDFPTPLSVMQAGYEVRVKTTPHYKNRTDLEQYIAELSSIARTKTTISDIVLSNDFDLFTTFTFKSNRQDILKCKKTMSNWLHSQQKTYGSFSYLIVPEFHKDKKSIHFHALFNGYAGKLTETKIKQNGRLVYNIKSYKGGYSTAVKIDDKSKVSSYIKKYITKDMPMIENKKRYWCSTKLTRPIKIHNPKNIDMQDYELEYSSTTIKIYRKK